MGSFSEVDGIKDSEKAVVSEDEEDGELAFPASMMDEEATKRDTKLSETLVEIEDFLGRVIWTIQHSSDGCVGRDTNVENQRCRIEMQLAEMQSCEEDRCGWIPCILSEGVQRKLNISQGLIADLRAIHNHAFTTYKQLEMYTPLTRSFADSQMDELVCQLEQEVSASFQDTPLVHLRISEMEEFLSRTPPICTPCNAEASSLRSTLQILSDVILRLNSAVQLLERMAFLTNLHPSQRLKTLRFAYPRALEGLTRCFRALDALLRELAEWRKCIILVEDSDQRDTATQAVIEVVNFAMDVITQELQRVSTVEFFNAPDFLSQILAWLSSFHASLIGFRKAICQYRLEKSAICSHSSALLQDLLNLEWLITDSRLQSSRDMTRDVGGTAAGYIKTSWMASIQKILAEIEPTKRRRLLNLLEGMERSSRERRRSLLGLLLGSREPVKIFEGVTMLNYIVARTEGFTDLEVQALEEKYAGTEDYQSNDCSHSVAHLEESLQALRQTARILFTCLSTDSQPSSKVTPSKHLDVNELYRRAVKLVNDYEASEIGCQILEAWQQLQSIADKLGRLQAGASMARKRSWSLLEILGSHECLYPGCRGKKSEKHEIQAMNDGLLHDLHSFYSLLCSEFHDRAMRIPVEVLTSSTQEAASSEIALLNLRQEWYRNVGLVNQFNSLHRRVKLDGSGRSEVRSSFALIEDIWGEATPLKAVFEATERLATVSSWLCEVERYLELDVLPRLQTAWKKSSEDDTLSVVEEYVYKMNEVAEDLEDLEKSGILAERHLKTVKHSLQAGWFSVREFLLNRCVEPAFHEDPTSVRYFPLVDDFLRHSVGLGFQDCDLKAIHTRLCNQYLFHGLPQREHHPVPGGRKFCSTHRSLRSLFLPAWLTERCRIVQHRPPVALTIHSIPDIYTEAYPPLSSTAELAFYSPNCIALQSQRWLSLPNIRSQSPTRRETKRGGVNWGPLVARPESPHLSVIAEVSADESTLEKHQCFNEKLQKPSQVYEEEKHVGDGEWKTAAPKKTRSSSNRAAKKMDEEEEERTEGFTSPSPKIPTFWDSEDKHGAPTPTQTSFGAKDGIQIKGGRVNWGPLVERPESPHLSVISEASTDGSTLEKQKCIDEKLQKSSQEVSEAEEPDPQEGDSDGETDKTISEVLPSEVRVNENESAKSLQKIMESSSDSVCGPNIKAEPFYEEMVEQGAELVDGNAIERQDTELCAAIKTFLQTTGKDENGFKEEPQSPEDGILEKTTFVEVGSEDVSEPRDEAEINLVQRDAGRDYRQRSQEVNFSVDERPPVEQTDTSEVNEQSGRGDFNSHLGKVGVNETNNEKISLNSTKSSTKPKRKLKKSRKKNSSEDPSTRVVSKPPSWNNVHRSAKFEGTDAITDGPSSTEQEVQILNEHKKGGNLLNGFQNAGKYDRGVATKPLAKKRKYRELINVREVSNSEGLPASKESGDVLSAVHAKFNHKAQIGVNIPEEEDNLFDSTVVDVDEGQFASEFIYDGLLVYDLQPDDEVKEEAKLKQKCNGGVEVEKAKTDTKDARSSLQKKNWVVKAAESLLEEVHPVDVDEPIDPAVLSSKLDHHQMDQHCIDEGVALKNKEVLLISSHLWEGEAKKGILHEVDLTKWSDEKDAKRGQSVEPIDDTKDDNTFIPTLKENACQDPEQSVALTTEMDKDRSCPEDANSTKKRKTKPKKGDRKERDLDRKSGNKEAVLSENLAVSDKVRVGNEAVSPANEFNAYVDKDGLEIKPKLQSDLSDLDEDLLRHLEENVHSGGRKIEIQGGDMDTLEETSTEDKGLESNGLGTVDTWNDLLSSKEFEIYSKEEKGKRITVKMDHLEGFGSRDVLRECTNEDAESQGHLAEARDSSDEIYQSGTIQRVDASSSSKAPEVPSIKGGKKKRHQRGRHIVSEVEVEECTTSTVPASREMSIIDAEVDHKASEVAAGVGHLMQPEEAKGALDIIGDGQVLVLETEKQPSTVLKEASKQIQHQHVAGKLNDQLEDESQVNECDPEAGGETVDELRAVAEANVMKNLNEGEEGEHLQYEHATEGVGGELQPQTSQDTMRWEDSEFQEHPVEGPDRLDEFDQSETIQRVDALSSPEVSEVPSIKSGKKKSKRHRKESHPFVVKVEAQTLDSSTVLPATVMADLNDEAELNITEAFVDEQEFASDLLKEPQPIHHEVVVKELPEHPEDRFQINDSKSDVQDESADESRAVGETSNLVSGYESKQHSAEQEKREKYFEEGGERTQDERDVEDGSDESQPRANEEALKMSTDEGVETPNDLIEGEGYVNEIVEPESNPIFGDLSASQEHEGISVRGEGKKRRRKERYFQDEGEVETLEATADVGYPLEPEDDTKTKNIATNGKEFASGGSEEVSQPSEHDLMEKETPGHLGDEAQSIKHKLEVQGMSADGSKPHLTEENEKNWDNEEREHWQGEGGNVGDEDELRPQENEDIWSETTDERDAKPFKRPTEGEDNVNKIADPATIQGVDTLSSSQESETPPVKSKTKKQHRKKKQLLSEVEMVVGVEPPIQTEEDKSALDVVVGRQGSVLGIGKHSQPNEQEFAVKESFIYLEGKPQTDECNLEVQRDLVNESRGIGEVDELLQLDECEPHLGQKEKERKHREEGKHWPGESEFEGVGDKSQVLTNEEDDEESCNSRLKVGDDIAEIVGAETPRTTDVLPSSQEPEGLSMKIGERSQHPEDSYLQNGTGAQKLETSTAFSLKELSGMVDEGEFETARTAVDEQRKEHHEEEEGEDLLNESNVEGVGDDLRPQTNKGILQECTKEDVESQKHPAQARYGSDKIDKFETTYGVVILSSPEESEASSMKGGKKKRHRKKRHLMNKAEVEECTASTVLASQEMSIMDAEADLKTPEAAPGVGYSLQSEEAKSASDIIVDGQEPVSDIEKQPIVILEGASPPIRHEFVENKSTDYPEDESQINECELVVEEELVNELKTVDKANDIEHFHVPRAHSEEQGKKKWHCNEGEKWQKKRGTDTIGSESQPQREAESPSQPTEGEDSLNVASKSEAIQDIGAMASSLEPETLSIRGEKGRKQRKKAFPQDEGVIQSAETVAEDENTLIITTEDGASSYGLLKKVTRSNVLKESSDCWEDVAQSRKYTLEDQNEIVDGSRAIDEADELEAHPGGQERMQIHGEVEHCLNKSGVGDADDVLQLQRNKETMREFTDEGEKTNKSPTKGGDNVELIVESEVVQGVEAVSRSQEPDPHSLKRGRRAKHRKGRHPNAEAEAQECVTSTVPAIQGMAGANDEADLKVSEVAADVGYLMQPEEGKCTLDVTVEEEKSASDALEEIPQSNEQELVEGKMEDGLHSNQFKWEILGMTVDEFKTVCQSDDLVHSHETDKKPWKQDEKLSHSEVGELWHDELCLEGVANATQPQTDARDLKDFTDEAAGSQENLRKGEIVASEAIPSVDTLPSSQKLGSPSINRKEKAEIEEESHQKGNSISSPEDQLSQKKGKTDLDSVVGGHLSTPQIYPDDQLKSNLDEFAGSDDLSNQHVKSDDEASQPRFEVREVPSHQGKKKPPRAEFSSDDYRDEKVSNLWTPSLPPPGSARETVTKDGLEIPGGRDDQFANCEPYSANSVGEKSQALDFATTEDLTVAVEYTHSPFMKNSPKVDNLPCLSQDLSHDSDEDPSQTDNTMENEETVAVIGRRSTQEEMPMSVDISEPLNGRTLKLKPSQESKESSKKKDKKRKHPKEKSPECGEPLEVVDVEIDERPPPEHESEAASTKCGKKKKKHQREKYLKNVHTAEEDSKSLSTETKVENHPADKVVLGGEHVQITSTAPTSREGSESFAEQVDKSNVPSVSLGTEGRSPVSKMEMELQKQPTAGSDVDRENEDGKKSNQEGYNLECNPELQNTEAEENLTENNLKQIESWKESELKECPGATTLETVGPNVTTSIPILGETKEDNQRAKELSRNSEAQGKDEKELELSRSPDVDANKEQDDQQLKEVDNPFVSMEEEGEISLEEFPGLNELEFCQNHREFGENSIDTGSKFHEANLSPNPDEEAIPVAVADEQAWKDEERLENRVGDVSDKYFELSLHPVKDVDVLEDLFVSKVSEASVNHSTSQKPPKSAMPRKESHQGSEITTLSDSTPSTVDVGIDDLQETESVKSIQKENKEEDFEESSSPHFYSSTAGDCSALVAEEEKEELPPYDSTYETEVYRPELICTGLPFPQELGGKAAEANRGKKKRWRKVSTTKDTEEYLTPAVEADEQPECVKPVDETLIPVDADTSQVVGADKDLVNKDISQQKVEKENTNNVVAAKLKGTEFSPNVVFQDVGSASRELDSGGRVQGTVTGVKTEEAFSLEPNKRQEEKGKTAKGECSSTINPPEMSHLSNNGQRWPEMEREGTDVATDPQQSLGIEVPVEVIHPEMTSTPKGEDLLSSKSSTEIIQPSDVVTSSHPSSTRKKYVNKEPCVEVDIESGRQVENVEEAEEEEEDEGPVTSTDHSFTLIEQSPSDTDEVDDFTVVVKSPAPRTIIEAEATVRGHCAPLLIGEVKSTCGERGGSWSNAISWEEDAILRKSGIVLLNDCFP
ncbi:hypothetical protein EGR_07429 [Echinococcus granulosus]|uniref:Uncharacterized protein n=1 Tax=Echinococcus granulosus TaxID=6210 RepID=W6U8Q2_ECHGR|nr:hypothetical protein EGR_07429 [Echinococcus granulosus]EUB57688.1 hypothetical protein EGR_07429 [Echinococcus granulosus]